MAVITDVRVQILKPSEQAFAWKEGWPARNLPHLFVRIMSDQGVEGHCITWLAAPGAAEDAYGTLRALLIGRDPHDIEAISYQLTDGLQSPDPISSAVDIALWDLVGKLHEQPVYKLLGGARNRIPAYASTFMYDTVQEYVDLALECREEGYKYYKMHAWGVPEKDIEVCRAVREAVGDTMELMLDPVNAYDRVGAMKVGRVLEELDFFWYEAPIEDTDIQGLKDLTDKFRMPIAACESVKGGLKALPPYLTGHVVDSVRSVGDWIGGITPLKKAAGMCEAFGVKYEMHSYGTTLIQAAHLHVMLSIFNCDLVELPVPTGVLDMGMKEGIRITKDGYVNAPTKPGLGYDVDLDALDALTLRELKADDKVIASPTAPAKVLVG
jgi:L-alanine-DL-glutamate epimerase-like enolase superfamily enzyme